jgi:hypothetical protein
MVKYFQVLSWAKAIIFSRKWVPWPTRLENIEATRLVLNDLRVVMQQLLVLEAASL